MLLAAFLAVAITALHPDIRPAPRDLSEATPDPPTVPTTADPAPDPSPSMSSPAAIATARHTARPTRHPRAVTYSGTIWWADESLGDDYLAIPVGPGHRVRVCGPALCLTLRSNDAGPTLAMQRQGRIADLAVGLWERICGVDRRFGGCPGTITLG